MQQHDTTRPRGPTDACAREEEDYGRGDRTDSKVQATAATATALSDNDGNNDDDAPAADESPDDSLDDDGRHVLLSAPAPVSVHACVCLSVCLWRLGR